MIDDIDALKRLKADEQRAFDEWLEEVRTQRANQRAGQPVSGKKRETLWAAYERAKRAAEEAERALREH